jgi:hypothetical protein
MSYEAVYLYNSKNEFQGVAIKKADAPSCIASISGQIQMRKLQISARPLAG